MPEDSKKTSTENRASSIERAKGIFRSAETLNKNAQVRRERDETAFGSVEKWSDVPKAMKARMSRNLEVGLLQNLGVIGEAIYASRRADVGTKLDAAKNVLKLNIMSALGGGTVIGEYFANKISQSVNFSDDPSLISATFKQTNDALNVEFKNVNSTFVKHEKAFKRIDDALVDIQKNASKPYEKLKESQKRLSEQVSQVEKSNLEFSRVSDKRLTAIEKNLADALSRLGAIESEHSGSPIDKLKENIKGRVKTSTSTTIKSEPEGKVKFSKKLGQNISGKLGDVMKSIRSNTFGEGVMGTMRATRMLPAMGAMGTVGLAAAGAGGAAALAYYLYNSNKGGSTPEAKSREEANLHEPAGQQASEIKTPSGIDYSQMSFEQMQADLAKRMQAGEKFTDEQVKEIYASHKNKDQKTLKDKSELKKAVKKPLTRTANSGATAVVQKNQSGLTDASAYYDRMRTEEDKKQFLLFGKLPGGFEFVQGNNGRLGSAEAVAASGAMPFNQGGSFGSGGFTRVNGSSESSGTRGSYFPSPSGVGAPSPAGSGQPILGDTTSNELKSWRGNGVGSSEGLAGMRQKWAKELENPELREKLLALTYSEVGNASKKGDMTERHASQRALMETIMNRGSAQKYDSLNKVMTSAYYEPMQNSTYSNRLAELRRNPKLAKELNERLEEVLRGSNDSNFGTHNSSAGVAASAEKTQNVTARLGGETYSTKTNQSFAGLHGAGTVRNERQWLAQAQAAVAASNEAKDGKLAPLSLVPQNVLKESLAPQQAVPNANGSVPVAVSGTGIVERQQSVARTRRLPISNELKGYMSFASQQSGVGFEVTSGAQIEKHGQRTGSMRHNIDLGTYGAADGKFFVNTPEGGKRYLSTNNKEDAVLISSFVKNFAAVAPGAGVGANYMNGETDKLVHVGGPNRKGGPAIAYAGPSWFRAAHASGLQDSAAIKEKYNAWLTEEQAKASGKPSRVNSPTQEGVVMSEALSNELENRDKSSGEKAEEKPKPVPIKDRSITAFAGHMKKGSEAEKPASEIPANVATQVSPIAVEPPKPQATQVVDVTSQAPAISDATRAGFSESDTKPVNSLDTVAGVPAPSPVDVPSISPERPAIAETSSGSAPEEKTSTENAKPESKESGERAPSSSTDGNVPQGGGRYNPETESSSPGSSGYGEKGRCFVTIFCLYIGLSTIFMERNKIDFIESPAIIQQIDTTLSIPNNSMLYGKTSYNAKMFRRK